MRLGSGVIFPFISSHLHMPRIELHKQLTPIRLTFLLGSSHRPLCLYNGLADLVIKLLYDQRYYASSWMLPLLSIGSWFAIISNLNESTVLGLGQPQYGAFANSTKFGFLLIGLTLCAGYFGVLGAIVIISLSELARYIPILIGQRREIFSFGRQDLMMTLVMFGLIGIFEWIRWRLGFGTSIDTVPFDEFMPFLRRP